MTNSCNHRCDHEENRRKVCAPCGRKINPGTKKLDYFCISEKHEKLIKEFINNNFDLSNPRFPSSVCTNCRKILQEHDRNDEEHEHKINKRLFKNMPNYEDIILPKNTRECEANVFICNCYVCLTGRHKGLLNVKNKLSVGESLNLSIKITSSNGMYGSQHSNVTEIPKSENQDKQNENMLKICRSCFEEVGRGIKHFCISNPTSKLKAVDNLKKFITVRNQVICGRRKEHFMF